MVLEHLEDAMRVMMSIRGNYKERYTPRELLPVMGAVYDALAVARGLTAAGLRAFKECCGKVDTQLFCGSIQDAESVVRNCVTGVSTPYSRLQELEQVLGLAYRIKQTLPEKEFAELYARGIGFEGTQIQ
ncbi:hypothetical protein J4211_00845 [Candidatus Woesearchaeota archaeon]|nr:hypothetical protein [Candidatus Woesearchaeota archaeon]